MDEYNLDILSSSKDEFTARIITLLTPEIINNMDEIFKQSQDLSKTKNLAVFQKCLTDIPKWSPENLTVECDKLKTKLNCSYLDDLITCIFLIQLKYLSAIRPSPKNKTIQLNIPSSEDFIWKIYINTAKKIYKNVYLYAPTEQPQELLKNKRNIEILVREAILETIRNYIPMGELLKKLLEKENMKEKDIDEKEDKKKDLIIDDIDEVLEQNGEIIKHKIDRQKYNKNLYGSINEDEEEELPASLVQISDLDFDPINDFKTIDDDDFDNDKKDEEYKIDEIDFDNDKKNDEFKLDEIDFDDEFKLDELEELSFNKKDDNFNANLTIDDLD
jgi:hypothetical protein